MNIEAADAAAKWLWETIGKHIFDQSKNLVANKWRTFNWARAEDKYRKKLLDQLSTVRLLGNSTPIYIENIYTDVEVLDKLTAMKRFNFEDIQGKPISYDPFESNTRRFSALEIVKEHKRTYILGKPGAGKTTFLKSLVISACHGSIKATPIYISLKEWSDSQLDLFQFTCEQFKICGFPDEIFVKHILNTGNALVLLDGLDEVNHADEERRKMLQAITNFTNQHSESRFCITCRIAANEYAFNRFTYVEIADFNEVQQTTFISKWYSLEPKKLEMFKTNWNKTENEKIRELGKTPLLLALICLAFDETLQFSRRRVDLYAEAIDALLKKWDSSRAIVRRDAYKLLESVRKKQLLSFIAYNTFVREEYLIRNIVINNEIKHFISSLPYWDNQQEVDSEQILKSIESHHGLLVERAKNIYSFSHLTVQEYFSAQYISDNVASDSLGSLVNRLIEDVRWREVMLMCASMQSNAYQLLHIFAQRIWKIVKNDIFIKQLIKNIQPSPSISDNYRANSKDEFSKMPKQKSSYYEENMLNRNFHLPFEYALDIAGNLSVIPPERRSDSVYRARNLVYYLGNSRFEINKSQANKLTRYLLMTKLLIECLQISSLENRQKIEELVLKDMS
jgi:predicted NACHT family NTPase